MKSVVKSGNYIPSATLNGSSCISLKTTLRRRKMLWAKKALSIRFLLPVYLQNGPTILGQLGLHGKANIEKNNSAGNLLSKDKLFPNVSC
jgi:hypothetical protein